MVTIRTTYQIRNPSTDLRNDERPVNRPTDIPMTNRIANNHRHDRPIDLPNDDRPANRTTSFLTTHQATYRIATSRPTYRMPTDRPADRPTGGLNDRPTL